MSDEYFEISGEVVAVTERAVLINDGEVQDWIPFSQCSITEDDCTKGEVITFEVKEWLLKVKGFI